MFRSLCIASLLMFPFAFAPAHAGDTGERLDKLESDIRVLLKEGAGLDEPRQLQKLKTIVDAFNAPQTVSGEEVVSLDPLWLPTQLRERNVTRGIISECGADLPACDTAKERLRMLTMQCSDVFLGIIDLEKYPGTPKNLYEARDPTMILLMPRSGETILEHPEMTSVVNPDTVAIALCPEESRTFGPAMQSLHMLGTIGRQPR